MHLTERELSEALAWEQGWCGDILVRINTPGVELQKVSKLEE